MEREHAIVVAILLLLVAVIAWWLRTRRRAPAVSEAAPSNTAAAAPASRGNVAAARKAALAAIDAIEFQGRERGLQLATIARRYLVDAHAIPATTCTTAELNELLRRDDLFDDDWRAVLESLDAVRFGGPAAIRDLETHLRKLLERT